MKILLIGPLPPPIHGVGLANKVILEQLPLINNKIKIKYINTQHPIFKDNIGKFSLSKVLFHIRQYKFLRILKVDIVYITPSLTFLGVLKYAPFIFFSSLLNKKMIVHIHGDYLWLEYKRISTIKKQLLKTIISKFDKGIALSPLLSRNLIPFLPGKDIHVLPNFVEDFIFTSTIENKMKNNFDKLRILFLSNLMKEKGIFDLLEALLILKQRNIDFVANIAGEIDTKYEQVINKYLDTLEGYVSYFGVVQGKNKKELFIESNTFVFPTYYKMEGQPISLLEAMATGNILITTKHAGIPDIFTENINGYYIDKKNPQSIAEKLIWLSTNLHNQRKIAQHNYKEAQNKYRMNKFISSLNDIFKLVST